MRYDNVVHEPSWFSILEYFQGCYALPLHRLSRVVYLTRLETRGNRITFLPTLTAIVADFL